MKLTHAIIAAVALFIFFNAQAQKRTPIEQVIDAEKSFAKYSLQHSTRDAFLTFLADDGILFNRSEPVNGKKVWEARAADQSLLSWWPQYADVGLDGTLGYTTGPWLAKRDRQEPEPGSFGFYSTVWRKQSNGEWKAMIDISIPLPQGLQSKDTTVITPKQPGRSKLSKRSATTDINTIDSLYNKDLSVAKCSYIKSRFADDSRIHRRERWPYTTPQQFDNIKESVTNIRFKAYSKEITQSDEMAYTFGQAFVTEDNGQEKVYKYLRVWKRFGSDWKIVLDVLS